MLPPGPKIRIMCADDSALMRKILLDIFAQEPRFEVLGAARNGKDLIYRIKAEKPDVVTLDVDMPIMNGLQALEIIMAECPVPVLMLSSLTHKGSVETVQALSLGALDYIPKPSGMLKDEMPALTEEICRKIMHASMAKVRARTNKIPVRKEPTPLSGPSQSDIVIAIGISTGGPAALRDVFPGFPPNMPPIVIVQHMPKQFTGAFASRLDAISSIHVKEAEDGDILEAGCGYLAPGDAHVTLSRRGTRGSISLSRGAPRSGHKPSADELFFSVAKSYQQRSIAVLMTGMGRDGADGMAEIKSKGGITIVQDEESSVVWGMPRVAYEMGVADHKVAQNRIAKEIIRCTGIFQGSKVSR